MIICRTPFRISFFGGGTDYVDWYRNNGGSAISTTINKYSYITVRTLPPFFEYKHRLRYFNEEYVQDVADIQHPSIRECIKFLNIRQGLEIVHNADLPARSGLGSSSTFTVGMLQSLHALSNRMLSKHELAMQAIYVEQQLIGEAVGSQDQFAAACGGFNQYVFQKSGEIAANPILLQEQCLQELQDHLLLCFTGFARTACEIAALQIKAIDQNARELNLIGEICDEAMATMQSPESWSIHRFAELMDEQWKIKRRLNASVSSSKIDFIYDTGKQNGALAGKLLGAGGGGFMLFLAPNDCHMRIKKALNEKMFVPIRFEKSGSTIIYKA